MNLVINGIIYYSSRRAIYLRITLFWAFLIVNFLIQSKAQGSEMAVIMGFGFTMLPLALLSYASLAFTRQTYPWKILLPLMPATVLVTFYLMDLPLTFTQKAMPFALTAALPLFYTVYVFLIKNYRSTTTLMKFHALVLFFLAIHSFNFALFRMEPEAQLWGWPVAYALYQLLAGLIPAMTLDFYHREERQRLRHIIDEKTKNLQVANQYLEKVAQQKNYLFQTLTHDISTPLMIAQGKIQAFRKKPGDFNKFVTTINDLNNRMKLLVEQVRTFDSFQLNEKKIETEEVNLMTCVEQMEVLFEDRLKGKELHLSYDRDQLCLCFVNVELNSFVNSVLANIIGNAIKFSYSGGAISIDAEACSDFNGVQISIRDQGMGMPEDIKNNIFDFDAQTSRRGTSNEAGTGFGMPIMNQIIDAIGGEVTVESQEKSTQCESSYTCFIIKLSGHIESAKKTNLSYPAAS